MQDKDLAELVKAISSANVATNIFEENRPAWAELQGKVIQLANGEVDSELYSQSLRPSPEEER